MAKSLFRHLRAMLSAVPPPPLLSSCSDPSHPVDTLLPDLFSGPSSHPTTSSAFHVQPSLSHSRLNDVEMADSYSSSEPRFIHQFNDLPAEIHEAILDYLFGVRGSALASITTATATNSSWKKALRHPRRKELSDLALVSHPWRALVQERIYRHIQVKGTVDGLAECASWFASHPHLQPYIRHIEIWVPVWGDRLRKSHFPPSVRRVVNHDDQDELDAISLGPSGNTSHDTFSANRSNCNFRSANHNASLQQIFQHVASHFPHAKMLSLKGGHCKKPPMIQHFQHDSHSQHQYDRLETLPNIQTFIMKGAWNIMRNYSHWTNLSRALPNLREWHCFYAKSKTDAQLTVSLILLKFPPTITRLNISFEDYWSKTSSRASLHSQKEQHICLMLGSVFPQLESLTFTGKICACLFTSATTAVTQSRRPSRLKSVDLVVKACCWDHTLADNTHVPNDVSGITNMTFIDEFEKLVLTAIRSLDAFPNLQYMRIRFIDLDSLCGFLNPYFQLVNYKCTGLWSPSILEALHQVRPTAQFEELGDGILPEYGINARTGTRDFPRFRPLSIKKSAYKIIADKSKQ
ncbi:hypothetical protein FQN57_003531 [Myotisia sp. PD_48]|nr:hypothetical protein FQN57_003531 [Myotisia sp. PD_48]